MKGEGMKANKVVTVIKVETLSLDSVPFKLEELINAIRNENASGTLVSTDGDTVAWETTSTPVEF